MKNKSLLIAFILIVTTQLFSLDFIEDWETGDFETNGWTFEYEQGNWQINNAAGNPGSSASFTDFPFLNNYNYILISPVLDGTESSSVFLSYDLIGRVMRPGAEHLSVEIRIDGGNWTEIANYNFDTPGGDDDWLNEAHNISTIAGGNDFQIGFRAYGITSLNINHWYIDNISLYETAALELPFVETWTSQSFATNNWGFDPNQASWDISIYNDNPVAEFYYDDFLNYSYALVGPTISALENDTVELSYDICLYNYDTTGTEYMAVEVYSDDEWQEIATYCNDSDDFSISESFVLSDILAGSLFNIRFRAYGDDAFNIDAWTIDNIIIADGNQMEPPHIFGHVINAETNEPITDATVIIDNSIQISSNEGGLNSELMGYNYEDLLPGDFQLLCTASGYNNYFQEITIAAGEEFQIDIMLQPQIQNLIPQNLHAVQSSYDQLNLSWDPVVIDEFLQESYDDSIEDFFAGFQTDNTQIIANRFQFTDQIELQKADFFVNPGTAGLEESTQILFCITGDIAGTPDLNNMLAEPVLLQEFDVENISEPFWLSMPTNISLDENTAFHICLIWTQQNPDDDVISLGIDINNPQGYSSVSFDSGASWDQELNNSQFNAMIRCQYLPIIQTDQIFYGYNLYRDNQIVNNELITQNTYSDSGLTPGEYTYQVSAMYNNIESELSESITAEAGLLPAPYNACTTFVHYDQPQVNLYWQFTSYQGIELTGFNIYRNGEMINQEIIPPNQNAYEDTDISNGMYYSYQFTAVYDLGESDLSEPSDIEVLFSPNCLYTIPWQDHIEIGWNPPSDPVEPVELLGYNLYNSGILVNTDPITVSTYMDYNFQNQNEYWVKAVYSTGESLILEINFTTGGTQVILPPSQLDATIEEQDVFLNWESPDNGSWVNWDSDDCGESFGLENYGEFTAAIEFDQIELQEYDEHNIRKIAFYPIEEAEFTVVVWSNYSANPQEYYIMQEIPVEDYQLNKWNVIPVNNIEILGTITKARIGIRCSNYTANPLICDNSPNICQMSDYVLIDDEWTNLSTDHGINANWKIRMYIENEFFPGQWCDTRIDLFGYNIYRDNELITEVPSVHSLFTDLNLPYGEYSYQVSGLYYISNLFIYESELCDALDLMVLEPYYPAPENFEAALTDYNTVCLSWEIEPLRDCFASKHSSYNQKGINETLVERNRDLTGFHVYRNSSLLVTLPADELSFTDSLLPEGSYSYQIAATYDPHVSQLSPFCEIDVVLPAPIELSAEPVQDNVALSWCMPHPEWNLNSFTIFRNGELFADNITEMEFIDENVPDGNYIYEVMAVFFGNYQSELSEPFELEVVNSESCLLPEVTELQGNYPNPFNPVTQICFALSKPEIVNLKIYNIKGELVKTLLNDHIEAGFHQINWNGKNQKGKDVSSGIYFYQLQAGKYHALKKMSLMK